MRVRSEERLKSELPKKDEVKLATKKRKKSLKNKPNSESKIRKFLPPILNLKASDYTELIYWKIQNKNSFSSPPILSGLSDEDLTHFIYNQQYDFVQNVLKFPCHTQSVERYVKAVTEASRSVCGEKRRHGFIKAKLQSRLEMPVFNTKKQFKT